MKTIIFLMLIGISSSCVAQKKLVNLSNKSIEKIDDFNYLIIKDSNMIMLQNTSNKWNNKKQVSPNLSPNIRLLEAPYIKQTTTKLINICSEIISTKQLEELTKVYNSSLSISIKTDVNGKPIELQFYTQPNSILTLKQIEQIEKEIIKTFNITIKKYNSPYIKGSNFLKFTYSIYYDEMLKFKKENMVQKRN